MKKKVGNYKGKAIVEGVGEVSLLKHEILFNSNQSNKYKGEYYRVKKEYQRGYIKSLFKKFFYEGICQTDSFYGTFNLESIDDTNPNNKIYDIFYVKFSPIGFYEILSTTLKDYLKVLGEEKAWNEISPTIEPCTEEEYYSSFSKTKDDII